MKASSKDKTKRGAKSSTKTGPKRAAADRSPAEIDPEFSAVVEAFARDRRVVCAAGWGAGNTVLKVNGKIFAMTIRGELVVKISKERASAIVNGGTGVYFDPRHDGRLMKEWVVVGAGKMDWIELAREAHAFVGGAKGK